jgi:hypothetical protein
MMLRMRRRVMRRLRSICLIKRPEGFLGKSVPKDLVENKCVHEYNPSGRLSVC